ncbi:MBL fold metallo-hydrolase [Stygiolobus caldivivus]|uniref:MBL fold metallo-hydrolase n=1 Tax=Stygiolobus caldivivus TaxID=2824673 RepID=A0A8D5ZIB5_9CREN|nr:MBL fold metallo-hydrolase [Stygiolobus caldivivus]BCU69152.1 MBL fold metallo-hydrolase [Stygiolobus caldivivus]
MVTVKKFEVGELNTNCYLVIEGNSGILIDAGENPGEIIGYIQSRDIKLRAILATHGHFDHILGIPEIKKYFDGVISYLHRNDKNLVRNDRRTHSIVIDRYIDREGELNFGQIKVKVIETPGHTLGSVTYLIDSYLFTGDTLFNESIGRYDLGGDKELLRKSLEKLKQMNDLLTVYPGHGFFTTLGYEKIHNPFLNGEIEW